MKNNSFLQLNGNYALDWENIDLIAERTEAYLESLNMQRANILRIRLSIEEALLRWRDRFGRESRVRVNAGMRMMRPRITLELDGAPFDPLKEDPGELGSWADSLLSDMGYTPRYAYRGGTNIIELKLARPKREPAFTLLLACLLGVILGLVGEMLLPEAMQQTIIRVVLDPVYNAFLRLLNTAAGPIVFLSVLSAVSGIGSSAAMEQKGRQMVLVCLLNSCFFAIIAMLVSGRVFDVHYVPGVLKGGNVNGLLDFVLRIIPGDLMTPFVEGDSPQIVFMALVLGNALLAANSPTKDLTRIFEELNSVSLVITDWVSALTPFFLVMLITLGIMDGSQQRLLMLWEPLLFGHLLILLLSGATLLAMCWRYRLSIRKMILRIRPSFLTALRTASVGNAYGENVNCCQRTLGMDPKFTSYGLPLGLVVYMPAGTIATMAVTIFAAAFYQVDVNLTWYITALFLVTALQAASPPVAGAGLWGYAAIFSRLGIPTGALIMAIIADVLFGFVVSACNQLMLQSLMVFLADKFGLLDRGILQK